MTYYKLQYEKINHDGDRRFYTQHSETFSDSWIAYKEGQLLAANNSNVCNIAIREIEELA